MSDIMWTRWGGNVQLFQSEVNAGGTASLDYWTVKTLIELGHRIHIFGNLSHKGKIELENSSEEWTKNIIFHPEPVASAPEFISHIIISQGSENFRFGGIKGVPSQHWIYRLFRGCKVPLIYQQYDAYSPLFHNPFTRCDSSPIWGAGIREICATKFFVMAAGTNKEAFIDANYKLEGGHPKVIMWEKDIHQIAAPMIDKFGLESKSNSDVIPGICFIGKHRRGGSRGEDLLRLEEILRNFSDPNFKIHLYGKWKGLINEGDEDKYPRLVYHGTVKGGGKEVIKTYNNFEFSLIAGNERYKAFNQYTVRVFEVIASGTIPIFERDWFKTWMGIFPEDIRNFLLKNFCYDRIDDIPSIIINIRNIINGNRVSFSNKLKKNLRHVLSDEYIRKNLSNTLESMSRTPLPTREEADKMATLEIKSYFEYYKNHFMAKIRDSAEERYLKMVNLEFRGDYFKSASLDKNDLKNHFTFQSSEYSDDEIISIFGRSKNTPE